MSALTLFLSCFAAAVEPEKKSPEKTSSTKAINATKQVPPQPKKVIDTKKQEATKKVDAAVVKLADLIQAQYNRTKTATFTFRQSYVHPFLSSQDNMNNSAGNAAYDKNKGSMMWNYREPKNRQKIFYINGNKFTFYSISDKIAYTHDCYDQDTLSASVAFLLGTGNLKDSFTITAFEGEPANKKLLWLSLIPKEANSPVKKISLGVTKEGKVLESIVEDPSGGKNHFVFEIIVNPKIDDSVFVFKPIAGVRVQAMPNVKCAPKNIVQARPAPKVNAKPQPSKKN